MSRPTSNLRLFVAIYPPLELADALLAEVDQVVIGSHRLTPRQQVHLTMQFIGDTPSKDLDATIESVQRAAAGLTGFVLSPQRLITLPERGPARLIAAETDAPANLLELHRRLATRLARNVRDRDQERFRPHLTLCRFRTPAPNLKIDQAIQLPAFNVDRVLLMRSTLSSEGAQHHEVIACELAAR